MAGTVGVHREGGLVVKAGHVGPVQPQESFGFCRERWEPEKSPKQRGRIRLGCPLVPTGFVGRMDYKRQDGGKEGRQEDLSYGEAKGSGWADHSSMY